ncbi:MAG: hypothetical protein RhofKO_37490 [Rhodothermales bacterium]
MKLRNPKTGLIPPNIRARELAFAQMLPVRSTEGWSAGKTGGEPWVKRGPFRIGGRTRALAYDRTSANVILAGGTTGGIWRSADGGASWTATTTSAQLPSVSAVAQGRVNASVWYAGMGEWNGSQHRRGASYAGDGLYKSTDAGQSWSPLVATQSGEPTTLNSDFDYVKRLVVDPTSVGADVVLAATVGGIWRSADGGATWTLVLGDGHEATTYHPELVVTSTGVYYAVLSPTVGSGAILYRSVDGLSWVQLATLDSMEETALAVAPSQEQQVYIVGYSPRVGKCENVALPTECSSLYRYTYLSGDGTGAGGVLVNRSASLPASADFGASSRYGWYNTQGGYNIAIAVHPTDHQTVILGGVYLYRSTDGFSSSLNTSVIGGYVASLDAFDFYTNHHPDQHTLMFHPNNPDRLLSGHDGGISETTNVLASTVVWANLNNGYQTTQAYAVAIDQSAPNDETIVAGFQDNRTQVSQTSAPNGAWTELRTGDGAYTYVRAGKQEIYAASQRGVTYRYDMDGLTGWTQRSRIDPTTGPSSLFIAPYMPDPSDDKRIYFAFGDWVVRVNDVTTVPWNTSSRPAGTGIMQFLDAGVNVSWLTATPGDRVYVGGTKGDGTKATLARIDAASTASPQLLSIGAGIPDGYVSSIAVDPDDTDKVLVVLSNYEVVSVHYSEDAGATWIAVAGNMEENADGTGNGPSVRWVTIMGQGEARTYLVGTSVGLFSTTQLDGANTTWLQEGANSFGNVLVEHMMGRSSDGFLAIGTHGKGIYSGYIASSVEGTVRDAAGQPLVGVTLNGLPGNPTTDANGQYRVNTPWRWAGTVTPTKAGHTFRPRSLQFSNVQGGVQHDFYEPKYTGQVPTDGMQLWLRADRGVDLDGEGNVAAWQDASSHVHMCSQSAAGRRPGWGATDRFWTHAGVQFNLDAAPTQSTADWLTCEGLSLDGKDAATIITVFRTAHDREGTLVAFPNDEDANRIGFDLSTLTGSQVAHRAELSSGTYTTTPGTLAYADDAPHIAIAALGHDSGFDTQDLYLDGVGAANGFANGTGISIANAIGKAYLGVISANAGGSFFRGEVAEVLIYDHVLSDGDRAAITAYLAQKYQLGRTTNVMNMGESGIMRFPTKGAMLAFNSIVHNTSTFTTDAGALSEVGTKAGGLSRILTDRFWTISSDFAGGVDLTLDLSAFTGLDPSALTVARRTDASDTWRDIKESGATVTFHDPYVTIAGLGGFSDFALAELDALPVELTAFTARLNDGAVDLAWSTASETNNAGFHIEQQGPEGARWQSVGFVEGRGTTLDEQRYRYTVRDLDPGTYTFRIRQVDFGGAFEYSPTETVTLVPSGFALQPSYPNPATTTATLRYTLPQPSTVRIDVMDNTGRRVQHTTVPNQPDGVRTYTLDVSTLAAGLYHAIVQTDAHRATTAVVVVR